MPSKASKKTKGSNKPSHSKKSGQTTQIKPFQKTEAMLRGAESEISLPQESERQSKHGKPKRNNLINTDIGDFKQRIMGAISMTNQAVDKKPPSVAATSPSKDPTERHYSPSAQENVHSNDFQDEESKAHVFSEQYNYELPADFYKSNTDIRNPLESDKISHSETRFRINT